MRVATVGLLSDTHGFVDEALVEIFRGVDHIVHAGDVGEASVIKALERAAPVTAVRGNIDGGELRHLPLEAVVEIGGRRIAALHIAGSPSSPRKEARELLARLRPDALIVGHSHIQVIGRVQGALWINPGAAGRHGAHVERTALLLHVTKAGAFEMDRVHLGPRSARGA